MKDRPLVRKDAGSGLDEETEERSLLMTSVFLFRKLLMREYSPREVESAVQGTSLEKDIM